MSNEMFSNIGM